MTSEKQNDSDALAETLKGLTINHAGYYEADLENVNDAKGGIAINSKVYIHTSDRKKIKVTNTSNEYLQEKLLSNRTFLIITTTIDPQIDYRVVTSGASMVKLVTSQTTEVITDAARINALVLCTPGNEIWTGRDGTTPGE